MNPWLLASVSFAMSQLLLALALLPGLRPFGMQQRLYALFLLVVGAYLLDPLLHGVVADFLLGTLTVFVPGLFFLFSASLFDDDFRLKSWHVVAVGVTVVPPFIGRLLNLAGNQGFDALLFSVPQALEFVLLGFALFVAVRSWSPDLVIARRQLRLWFSGFTGLYIFLLILLREVLLPDSPALATLQFLPPCGVLFATNMLMLRYRRSIWGPPLSVPTSTSEAAAPGPAPESPQATADSSVDEEALDTLLHLMEQQHVYREMGLTLPELARKAGVPAYRLREVINTQLEHRNFNDFLNTYRIREAAERLRDPQQRETQVLVIALEAGFRSLSTFNKAFRRMLDTTPSEYRQRHLAS